MFTGQNLKQRNIMETKPKLAGSNSIRGETYTHPAYGCIQVSRVSGKARLFGSVLEESNHFITLSIHRAKKKRDMNHDYHFSREELIKVSLSTVQWGELLCSFNNSSGVPCTLKRYNGEFIEDIAKSDESIQEEIGREFKQDCAKIAAELDTIELKFMNLMQKPLVTKKEREEILNQIKQVKMHIRSNLPFVITQFTETVEKIKTVAKHEIVAWQASNGIQDETTLLLK